MINRGLPGTVTPWISGTTACSLCRAILTACGYAERMGTEWENGDIFPVKVSLGTGICPEKNKVKTLFF